jgi:hypothetical protein
MFKVLDGDSGCIGVGTDRPPYTLVATEEANVVDAFRVRLGLTTDQSVPGAKCMVPVPRGIQVGVSSVRTTDSNI